MKLAKKLSDTHCAHKTRSWPWRRRDGSGTRTDAAIVELPSCKEARSWECRVSQSRSSENSILVSLCQYFDSTICIELVAVKERRFFRLMVHWCSLHFAGDAVAISFKIRGVTLEPLLQAKPLMKVACDNPVTILLQARGRADHHRAWHLHRRQRRRRFEQLWPKNVAKV